jgi:hypothetical protein
MGPIDIGISIPSQYVAVRQPTRSPQLLNLGTIPINHVHKTMAGSVAKPFVLSAVEAGWRLVAPRNAAVVMRVLSRRA